MSMSINKVLLEHGHTHAPTVCGYLQASKAEVTGFHNIYHRALSRISVRRVGLLKLYVQINPLGISRECRFIFRQVWEEGCTCLTSWLAAIPFCQSTGPTLSHRGSKRGACAALGDPETLSGGLRGSNFL